MTNATSRSCACPAGSFAGSVSGSSTKSCVACPAGEYKAAVNTDPSCEVCSAYDANSWTNGTMGTSSTAGCVCIDPNMEIISTGTDAGKCGCRAGYYYDSTGLTSFDRWSDYLLTPLCMACRVDTFNLDVSLDDEDGCLDCSTYAYHHSYTNGSTAVNSTSGCICHTELGFYHGPEFLDTPSSGHRVLSTSTEHDSSVDCVCAPGTYYTGTACATCEIGTFQPDWTEEENRGCYGCESDFPPLDYDATFQAGYFLAGKKNFTGLYKGTTNYAGATSPFECHCDYGYFEGYGYKEGDPTKKIDTAPAHSCFHCTDGMTCAQYGEDYEKKVTAITTDSMGVEEGYWRPYADSLVVFECIHKDSCIGSNASYSGLNYGDGLCQVGHTGPYCEVCVHNETHDYAKDTKTGACIRCDPEAKDKAVAAVSVLGAVFLFTFCFAAYKAAKKVQGEAEAIDPNMTDDEREFAALKKIRQAKAEMAKYKGKMADMKAKKDKYLGYVKKVQKAYKSLKTPLKILISFGQIVSGLPKTLDMKYPPAFAALLSQLNFVNIDLAGAAASTCLMEPNYYTELFR